jgi:hypothetical protein
MNVMGILDFLTLGNRVEKPSRKRGRQRDLSCGSSHREVVPDPSLLFREFQVDCGSSN